FWFWVIPLQGRTSLGLVYDKTKIPEEQVSSAEKVVSWICAQFPLFARDLPTRKIVDQGMFRDFAYDCRQTISAERWALSGEAGRFTDPLYSPGGDLIALHNTLIFVSILTGDPNALAIKIRIYDLLMWAFYEAYVPSYSVSYDALGDQECYAMKYGWELTIYFTFSHLSIRSSRKPVLWSRTWIYLPSLECSTTACRPLLPPITTGKNLRT